MYDNSFGPVANPRDDGGMDIMGPITRTETVTQTKKASQSEVLNYAVNAMIKKFDIRVVNENGVRVPYINRHSPHQSTPDPYYRKMTEANLRHFIDTCMGGYAISTKTTTVYNTIMDRAYDENVSPDNSLIYITDNLYWDQKAGDLVTTGVRPCWRHMVDTTSSQDGVPMIATNLDDDKGDYAEIGFNGALNKDTIIEWADRAYRDISEYQEARDNGDKTAVYPERFDTTLSVWACNRNGVYLDLLKLAACPLLKEKPKKIFFTLGRTRNGKSTYSNLLKTAYGANNTCPVATSQFDNWSYTGQLVGKMLNIPDEDDVSALQVANFKQIASHAVVPFAVKGAREPIKIKCDFVNIIPLNREPKWDDDSIDDAILQRVCILPFDADLASRDVHIKNFEESVYTGEFVSQFIGEIIGIARFYSEYGTMEFSEESNVSTRKFVQEHSNGKEYMHDFKQVFTGFASQKIAWESYQIWCRSGEDEERKQMARDRFDQVVREYFDHSPERPHIGMKQPKIYISRDADKAELGVDWQYRALWPGNKVKTLTGERTVQDLFDCNQDPVSVGVQYLKEKGLYKEYQEE